MATQPASGFDSTRSRFAVVHNNTLRIYDVKNGQLETTLTPPNSIAHTITCVGWGTGAHGHLVATGCENGKVFAWDLKKAQQAAELDMVKSVNTVAFSEGGVLHAVGGDQVKMVDCTKEGAEVSKGSQLPKGTNVAAVNEPGTVLVAGAKKLCTASVERAAKKLQVRTKFNGHSGVASKAVFVPGGERFVTTCDAERHLSLWATEGGESPVATLQLSDTATELDAASGICVCVAGSHVHVWDISRKKPQETGGDCVMTAADGCAVLNACVSGAEVLVAKGSLASPIFERVRVKEMGKWIKEVSLEGIAAAGLLLPSNKKRKGGLIDAAAVPVASGPTDTAALDKTLDERQSLGFKKEELLRRNAPQAAGRDRVRITQSLQQALARKDKRQIDILLDEGLARRVVDSSVMNLERTYALQLLRECVKRFQHKSSRAQTTLVWIRAVFAYHPQHLLSLPDLDKLLEPLQNVVNAHLQTYNQLSLLQGRLDVVVGKAKALKNVMISERERPLKVISEEEARMARSMLPEGFGDDFDEEAESIDEEGDVAMNGAVHVEADSDEGEEEEEAEEDEEEEDEDEEEDAN